MAHCGPKREWEVAVVIKESGLAIVISVGHVGQQALGADPPSAVWLQL